LTKEKVKEQKMREES